MNNPFFEPKEAELIDSFLKNGYVVFPLEKPTGVDEVRTTILDLACKFLRLDKKPDEKKFFDRVQDFVSVEQLNAFRVSIIQGMATNKSLRPVIYSLAKNSLNWIVGNELAMQRACNLSIQLPKDPSSLLPMHCDTWQGNSPFEVVFWLPLVDCYKTKSMYILPRESTEYVVKHFDKYSKFSAEDLFNEFKSKLIWLDVPKGHGLIFSHAMLHGNVINEESDTRWSMNIRFKPLLSPYSSKELGESFLPITLRGATRIGYQMKEPVLGV